MTTIVALLISASLYLAFFLGASWQRTRAARQLYEAAIAEARKDPEVRKLAADVRRRCETKARLRLVSGGREPVTLKTGGRGWA